MLGALLLLGSLTGHSQRLAFNHLSVENGLSQNSVLCIAKDSAGFMWLGTRNGLNRYDSRHFLTFRNIPGQPGSISNNYILSLLYDKRNHLWAGTRNGLNQYLPQQKQFLRVPWATTRYEKAEPFINCLLEDSKGRLWVGTRHMVYLITDPAHPVLVPLPQALGVPYTAGIVFTIFEDSQGLFWIGTETGLIRLSLHGSRPVTETFRHDPANAASLADNQVTSMAEDREQHLWIGTLSGGLDVYHPSVQGFTHYRHNPLSANGLVNNHIRKLLFDGEGRLWVGTQEGLSVMDVHSRSFTSYLSQPLNTTSLSQNSIHSLYQDNTGAMWIGTFFGGVNIYSGLNHFFSVYTTNTLTSRLSNSVVSSITEDDQKNLWIGTEGGGLNYLDRQTGAVTYFTNDPLDPHSLGSNLIKVLYKDRSGHIWAGTHGGGLNRISQSGGKVSFTRYLYNEDDAQLNGLEIACLLEDRNGLFWLGTELKGLLVFRQQNGQLAEEPAYRQVLQPLKGASIISLLEAAGNKKWIGTTAGLYVLENGALNRISGTEQLSINSIFEDAARNTWVCTTGGLLLLSAEGNKKIVYRKKDGLPDNNILGILPDDQGNLWAGTGNGLVRFNPARNTFNSYDKYDGLAGNTFNNNSFYKAANGEMFFGGYDGLTAFFPNQIRENKAVPAIVLTGFSLFNTPVAVGAADSLLPADLAFTRQLTLRHDQDVFSFSFAALNFINPQKNSYAYKLEGFDKDWNFTNNPTAVYNHVPPGHYTLTVNGTNNDGVWGRPASIAVRILPPLWKRWWAYALYLLATAILFALVSRFFYLRALLQRNNELTRLKLNFFTNVSHEIRTHLSLIIAPADRLIRKFAESPADRQQLQTIKNNSESLLQLVNELMDFRKAETGHLGIHAQPHNMVPFLQSICVSFAEAAAQQQVTLRFAPGQEVITAWFDKEQMEKVFYNLLSNALKFTAAGGSIQLQVAAAAHGITITVSNTGKGIAGENLQKIFDNYFQEDDHGRQNTGYGIGLALSKSIVDMHQGTIAADSQPVPGQDHLTTFTVVLRPGNAHFTAAQLQPPAPTVQRTVEMSSPPAPAAVGVADPANDLPGQQAKPVLLLVEDNTAIRSFLADLFSPGFTVLESADGNSGWQMATEHIPDLIISDVMMPGMDGFAFCQLVKSDLRTSHIPVIMLTAKNTVAHQLEGLETGADVYLTKPFSADVLELQVRNLLAAKQRLWQQFRSRLQQEVTTTPPAPEAGTTTDTAPAPLPAPLHPLDEAFIQQIITITDAEIYNADFGVAMLAKKLALTQPVLLKKVKAITGMTANDFVKSLRLKKACALLLERRYTVYEIAYMVGYENSKYFSREFKKEFGKTPSEYAQGV